MRLKSSGRWFNLCRYYFHNNQNLPDLASGLPQCYYIGSSQFRSLLGR
jgi:hypothetical protein